jgi:hypothetical protein
LTENGNDRIVVGKFFKTSYEETFVEELVRTNNNNKECNENFVRTNVENWSGLVLIVLL